MIYWFLIWALTGPLCGFSVYFKSLFFGNKSQWSYRLHFFPQDFSLLCYIYISFYLSVLPAVWLCGDVTQVVTMLSVSFSDLNQALSLVGSSFLVKSHWKPNLELASRGLRRKCCILQSISSAFNTLCGRSVAARRFIAAFVQLSMHFSYYTEWQSFIMNTVKDLLEPVAAHISGWVFVAPLGSTSGKLILWWGLIGHADFY